jgi:hypothetical protein
MEKEEVNEALEKVLAAQSDHKVSFAKVSWGAGKGPYLLAFEDTIEATYCESNALDFKAVPLSEAKKHDKLPIWECGSKTPEQVNKLPKLDMKKFLAKSDKEKADKKAVKAEKMKATKVEKQAVNM